MSPEDAIRTVAARYDGEDDEAARLSEAAIRRLAWRRRRGGKECSRCRAFKPVSAFSRNASRNDGLSHACRDCDSERHRSANPGGLL